MEYLNTLRVGCLHLHMAWSVLCASLFWLTFRNWTLQCRTISTLGPARQHKASVLASVLLPASHSYCVPPQSKVGSGNL